MRKRQVNIKDVAVNAGVSAMTVSRVLNNSKAVSKETRKKVQEAILRLGYRPNAIARSLKSQRTKVLGLVTFDLTDSFFTLVTAGAEAEARRQGYRLMLSSLERNPQDEPDFIRMLVERQVDGILVIRESIEIPNDPLSGLLNIEIPIVAIGYHPMHPNLEIVDIDNVDGGYQATRYLLMQGHRRIAMITGPYNHKSAKARIEGYRIALQDYGINYDPEYVIEGDWKPKSGYLAMNNLLKKKDQFTAVFVQSDEMAVGAYKAVYEAGLKIPQDISIIGYDDLVIAEFLNPPLTTIKQPIFQIGELSVQLLIKKINQEISDQGCYLLKVSLIERCSVRRI